MKRIVADTHVHLYPCHRLEDAFRSAAANLSALAGGQADAALVLFLAERTGSHFFADLAGGKVALPEGWQARPTGDWNAMTIENAEGGSRFLVINGRQVVTKERLEVLVLAGDPGITDGHEAGRVVEGALSSGAVPVLPWAPGKWLLGRGFAVGGLLRGCRPDQLLIGDTTLRPAELGEPGLLRGARKRGFKIVAGTDPLPFAGEERLIGQYGVTWEGELDEKKPVASLVKMMLDPGCAMQVSGRRNGILDVLLRLVKNYQSKRGAT
jgi:hypothetical protein